MSVEVQSAWGSIEVSEDARATVGPGIVMQFDWVAGGAIQSRLPVDQRLSFAVIRDQNGFHRVVPVGGVEPFLLNAALVGQTICERTGLFDPQRVQACDFDRLLFQQRTRIREAIRWHPNSPSSLRVAQSARLIADEVDVLPDKLGAEQYCEENRWSVAQLLQHGGDQAKLWGISTPDDATKIRCGLYRAALADPFDCEAMSHAELNGALRLALFCNDYENVPSKVCQEAERNFELIHERFREAVWPHLSNDTEEFNKWFYEESDVLIGQIAKLKRDGGPVSRPACRQIRLRMILEAYRSMANCLHVAMEEVRHCLPIELTEPEAAYLDSLYRRQSSLGELSLILLRDRLKSVGLDPITGSAETLEPGILLKVLYYYADMAVRRRMADRRYKRHQGVYEKSTAPTELAATAAASSCADICEALASQEQMLAVPALICESLKLRCHCDKGNSIRVAEAELSSDDEAKFQVICDDCEWEKSVTLTPKQRSDLAFRMSDCSKLARR